MDICSAVFEFMAFKHTSASTIFITVSTLSGHDNLKEDWINCQFVQNMNKRRGYQQEYLTYIF